MVWLTACFESLTIFQALGDTVNIFNKFKKQNVLNDKSEFFIEAVKQTTANWTWTDVYKRRTAFPRQTKS